MEFSSSSCGVPGATDISNTSIEALHSCYIPRTDLDNLATSKEIKRIVGIEGAGAAYRICHGWVLEGDAESTFEYAALRKRRGAGAFSCSADELRV